MVALATYSLSLYLAHTGAVFEIEFRKRYQHPRLSPPSLKEDRIPFRVFAGPV